MTGIGCHFNLRDSDRDRIPIPFSRSVNTLQSDLSNKKICFRSFTIVKSQQKIYYEAGKKGVLVPLDLTESLDPKDRDSRRLLRIPEIRKQWMNYHG